jgi:microcompartment protein CcmL/EutN
VSMKQYPAIAALEFGDIPTGIFATDAMVKKAPISVLKCGIISPGRYLTIIGGSTASVDESFTEGAFWGAEHVMDRVILPDVHPQLHDAILGRHPATAANGSMAVVQTPTVCSTIRAAEMALKSTPIALMDLRLAESPLAGKGISLYTGELYDVEAAMDVARGFLAQAGLVFSIRIIPAPHEAISLDTLMSAWFEGAKPVSLDGERVL